VRWVPDPPFIGRTAAAEHVLAVEGQSTAILLRAGKNRRRPEGVPLCYQHTSRQVPWPSVRVSKAGWVPDTPSIGRTAAAEHVLAAEGQPTAILL
jgi:hypothetical protein